MWFLIGTQGPELELLIIPADKGGAKVQNLSLFSLIYLSDFSFSSELAAETFYEENKAEIQHFHKVDNIRILNIQVTKTSWRFL